MQKGNRTYDPESAKRMREMVSKASFTREELAEKLGVSVRMIGYYLSGRSSPRAQVLWKLQELVK